MNLGPLQYNQVREPLAITGGERTEVVHTAMSYGAFSIPDNALLLFGTSGAWEKGSHGRWLKDC